MQALKFLIFSVLVAAGLSVAPVSKADEPAFSQAELDQMLAPIALYPDTVLSHVLIASTYPLEVIQAARWSRANPDLSGEQAVAAVEHMDWDPSVMALVAFPELLARMDEDIEWTQRLGDAFLIQEEQVVGTVQRLRDRAYAQGHLKTNEHVRVVRETEYIYIEPRRNRVVYVPYYDPRVVYGSWWWSAYPPVFWHTPRYRSGVAFSWGRAYHVSPRFYFSSFYWPKRQVVVVNHHHHYKSGRYFSSGREVARHTESRHWQHNPRHRRGVSYHRNVSERRFAEQPSGRTVRATANRQVQARDIKRDWAAERRENLDISQRGSGRATARTEQRAGTQRQSRGSESSAAATNRQGRSATQGRVSERNRSQASGQRAATPSRQASEVRESLSNREQSRSRNTSSGTAGRNNRADTISRTEPAGSRPAISRQSRSAPQASRPDAGSLSSRLQTTRPSSSNSNDTNRSRPNAVRSSPLRQSRPEASAPRTSTRQSSPAPSPRSAKPAPRQSSQQSAPPRRSSSAPARSAPRSAPSRSSNTNTRSSGNRASSNRASSNRSSAPRSRTRSRGGNREQ